MPVIEFPSEGPGSALFFNAMIAVMLFPQDDLGRRRWRAAAMARFVAERREAGLGTKLTGNVEELVATLGDLLQSPQAVHHAGLARGPRAVLTGGILTYLLRLAKHHPRHRKVHRAKALVIEARREIGSSVSESLLDKAWAEFKSVAPLWSAFIELAHDDAGNLAVPVPNNNNMLRMLSVAETCRAAAESARILKNWESWKAPETLDLPSVGIDFEELPPKSISFLDSQFPE
jgi:hypothetical protein